MLPFHAKATSKTGPEAVIQEDIITRLKRHDWVTQVFMGNMFQFGIPDLFAAHPNFGQKWIEVKNPAGFSFTPAQQQKFPVWSAAGVGIWILFGDSDTELMKLTKPANWFEIYVQWTGGVTQRTVR